MKLENRIFNDIEYTLVDVYELEKIYHFASDEDSLFCIKKDAKFYIIKDEILINEIKEKYDLNPISIFYIGILPNDFVNFKLFTRVRTLNKEDSNKFKQEQIDKLMELGLNIERKILEKRIRFADVCTAKWPKFKGIRACYVSATNAMYFNKKDLQSNDVDCKRTRLHETIHACTGMLGTRIISRGFLEGATENLVEKAYGDEISSYYNGIHFNLTPECTYKYPVSIIRQMQFALGKTCDNDILLGKKDFFKEFGKQYGKDILRYLKHRSHRLSSLKKMKNSREYFLETQQTLMERVFDRDFENIETLEDAKIYLSRLQEYGTMRGDYKDDSSYKVYFQEKFEKLKGKMKSSGYDITELESYHYEEPQFYPILRKSEAKEIQESWLLNVLSNKITNPEQISTELLRYKTGMLETDKTNYYFLAKEGESCLLLEQNRYTGKIQVCTIEPLDENEKRLGIKNKYTGEVVIIPEVDFDFERDEFQGELRKKIANKSQERATKQSKLLKSLALEQRFPKIQKTLQDLKMFLGKEVRNFNRSSTTIEKTTDGEDYGNR